MRGCGSKHRNAAPPTAIEQFTFWDGQTLRSSDLNDFLKVETARREWHNRALHNAYGISFGLEVVAISTTGSMPALHVSGGIAYDRFGRLLYQQFDLEIPFPSDVPETVKATVLFIRWCELDAAPCCCAPPAKCCLGEPALRGCGVELYWKDAAHLRGEEGVPIARALFVKNAKATSVTLDKTFVAPRLRRFDRPHILADATLPGATAWKLGPADLIRPDSERTSISWQPVDVDLDTSAAGFSQTPEYFAMLAGPLFSLAEGMILPVLFPHIANEFSDRFTFRFWIPISSDQAEELRINEIDAEAAAGPANVIGFDAFRNFARRQKLYVAWFGCEMPSPISPILGRRMERKLCGCGTAAMPLER